MCVCVCVCVCMCHNVYSLCNAGEPAQGEVTDEEDLLLDKSQPSTLVKPQTKQPSNINIDVLVRLVLIKSLLLYCVCVCVCVCTCILNKWSFGACVHLKWCCVYCAFLMWCERGD